MQSIKVVGIVVFAVMLILLALPATIMAQDPAPEFLVSLDDPMAAFLESRAYAAKMGATAEFRKMEWVALDEQNNKLYFAIHHPTSEISLS